MCKIQKSYSIYVSKFIELHCLGLTQFCSAYRKWTAYTNGRKICYGEPQNENLLCSIRASLVPTPTEDVPGIGNHTVLFFLQLKGCKD